MKLKTRYIVVKQFYMLSALEQQYRVPMVFSPRLEERVLSQRLPIGTNFVMYLYLKRKTLLQVRADNPQLFRKLAALRRDSGTSIMSLAEVLALVVNIVVDTSELQYVRED